MRQLIESIIVFQTVTSQFSPIHKWIPHRSVKLSPEERRSKWLAYSAIFTLAFVVQCYLYATKCKQNEHTFLIYSYINLPLFVDRQSNFYEVLELKPSATNLEIMRIEPAASG